MTDELFAQIVGGVVSFCFSYIPKLEGWYKALDSNLKRLVMAGFFLVVGGAIFGLSCAGVVNYFECGWLGALVMLKLVFNALIANQTAYLLTPRK